MTMLHHFVVGKSSIKNIIFLYTCLFTERYVLYASYLYDMLMYNNTQLYLNNLEATRS